ncbi:tryptophan synthase beta subunit-like PLP-dependent enzyme [Eremomyces bilateralis CBS 781.70]|uniref:L-serine ammonia-lyase n=1 Tax=Eremomyces bilateralis CBS 781.70 TaxID=1392243 RepID=A0A6G1GBX9_9PEZI|nr:tryptophan synthase beta subunit-like PLP-dependent enzyme [Eremomyces bilateralis CBS 781.70]KAF1815400.1 tryptophan synthase beta subunit-like PLP-dependent enzyme [Eremomyces bilateralis CBS 781.70]
MAKDEKPPKLPTPWVKTPLVESAALSKAAGCRVFLKLENLQPSGSFKSRGIGNYLLAAIHAHPPRTCIHFYSSSGGNAGLACVRAATTLGCKASVIVPLSTKLRMIEKINLAGADEVIQHGASWKEADQYLREVVIGSGEGRGRKAGGEVKIYVPPFDHEDIWEGNSTVVDEIAEQLPIFDEKETNIVTTNGTHAAHGDPPAAILCSVGGGGLFNGVVDGIERRDGWASTPVLAMETDGAHSLAASIEAGEVVTLPAITSLAKSLGASRVSEQTFKYASTRPNVKSVVLEDWEAALGCLRLADEDRLMVELACGVNVAMCFGGRLGKALERKVRHTDKVVIVLCGGSDVSIESMVGWRGDYAGKALEVSV